MLHWKVQLALLVVMVAALVASTGGWFGNNTAGFYW
jgi:hypothetical protein